MYRIVKVTRRGQTTIPLEIRRKLGIMEGDKLIVELEGEKIIFRKVPRLEELLGVDSSYGNIDEAKKELERMREEY